MPPNDDELNLNIQFDLKRREITQVQRGIKQVADSMGRFQRSQRQLAAGTRDLSDATARQTRPLAQGAKAAQRASKGQRDLAQETAKATAAMQKQGAAAGDLDGRLQRLDEDFSLISRQVGQAGDIESNIRAISGAVGTIPGLQGVGGAGAAGAEIFAVVEAAPRLKTAFRGLPDILDKAAEGLGVPGGGFGLIGVLGAVGVAAGAATLVIGQLNKRYEEQKEFVQDLIDREAERRQLEREGTQASIQADIEQLQSERAAAQDRVDSATERRDELVRIFAEENDLTLEAARERLGRIDRLRDAPLIGGAAARAAELAASDIGQQFRELGKTLDEDGQEVLNLSQRIENHLDALSSLEVQTRTQTEREKELAEARQQAAVQQISDEADLQRKVIQAQSQTSEQVEARIEALSTEREILHGQIQALEEVGASTEELQRQYDLLGVEAARLIALALPLVEAREQESAAIERQERLQEIRAATLEKDRKDTQARLKQLTDLNEKFQDAQQSHFDKLRDISDSLDSAISEADVKRGEALTKAQVEAASARAEAIAESQEDIEKLEEAHRKRLARITRRANASIANAIGERDALALLQAREQRDEQVKQETEAFAESRKAIDDQLQETNRQIEQRLKEQRRAAVRQYDETVRKAQDAARKAIATEDERHRRVIAQQRQASQRIIEDARNRERLLEAINRQGANGLIDIHNRFWSTVVAEAQRRITQIQATQQRTAIQPSIAQFVPRAAGGTSDIGFSPTALGFQFGGTVPRTGPVFAHQGERILTRSQQAALRSSGGGGINIPITIHGGGMSRRQIEQQVMRSLDSALDEAGL